MLRVVRFMALWLAAFWLPITMHCELASLVGNSSKSCSCQVKSACNDPACRCTAHRHGTEECKIIEGGNYRLDDTQDPMPMASLDWIGSFESVAFLSLLAPVGDVSETTAAPPGLQRTWQFVFRAALSPRAPSALC